MFTDKIGNWNFTIIELNIDDLANKWGVDTEELKSFFDGHQKKKDQTYPTTICYEFYDENDDLLPNQQDYRKVLPFHVDHTMRKKIHNCTDAEVRSYRQYGEEMGPKIGEKIKETTNGEYTLIDFFVDYENRGTYYVVYFQYKIKLS